MEATEESTLELPSASLLRLVRSHWGVLDNKSRAKLRDEFRGLCIQALKQEDKGQMFSVEDIGQVAFKGFRKLSFCVASAIVCCDALATSIVKFTPASWNNSSLKLTFKDGELYVETIRKHFASRPGLSGEEFNPCQKGDQCQGMQMTQRLIVDQLPYILHINPWFGEDGGSESQLQQLFQRLTIPYRGGDSSVEAIYKPVGIILLHSYHFTARWARGPQVLEYNGMKSYGKVTIIESLGAGLVQGITNIRCIFYQRLH
jgi:hypothetical protein